MLAHGPSSSASIVFLARLETITHGDESKMDRLKENNWRFLLKQSPTNPFIDTEHVPKMNTNNIIIVITKKKVIIMIFLLRRW